MSRSFVFAAAALVVMSLVAPTARAQARGSQIGPFDANSGRFTGGLPPQARPADTLAAPLARAWMATEMVYAQLGIPVTLADSDAHIMGAVRATQRRPVAGERLSRLLECGSGTFGPNAERYTVQLTAVTSVQALPSGGVAVETRVGGSAAPNGLNSSVSCSSTGLLEERILGEMRKLLGS